MLCPYFEKSLITLTVLLQFEKDCSNQEVSKYIQFFSSSSQCSMNLFKGFQDEHCILQYRTKELPPQFGGQWLQSPLLDGLFSEYVLLGLSINIFCLLIVNGASYKVLYDASFESVVGD